MIVAVLVSGIQCKTFPQRKYTGELEALYYSFGSQFKNKNWGEKKTSTSVTVFSIYGATQLFHMMTAWIWIFMALEITATRPSCFSFSVSNQSFIPSNICATCMQENRSCFICNNRCKSTSCMYNIHEVCDRENNCRVKSSWASVFSRLFDAWQLPRWHASCHKAESEIKLGD